MNYVLNCLKYQEWSHCVSSNVRVDYPFTKQWFSFSIISKFIISDLSLIIDSKIEKNIYDGFAGIVFFFACTCIMYNGERLFNCTEYSSFLFDFLKLEHKSRVQELCCVCFYLLPFLKRKSVFHCCSVKWKKEKKIVSLG